MESIPSIYLNMLSITMIGLSKKGKALKEFAIVPPIDCFNRPTIYLVNSLVSPSNSLILRWGTEIFS
jgi:hypothetical protein